MMNLHNSEWFAPVILGLGILVVTPALLQLVPPELVAALTATPLRRAASAFAILTIGGVVSLWVASRASHRVASAVEAARVQEVQGTQGGDD